METLNARSDAQLRALAASLGLVTTGTKAALVTRISDALESRAYGPPRPRGLPSENGQAHALEVQVAEAAAKAARRWPI